MKKTLFIAAIAALSSAGLASAQVIVNEDFESYASTAEMTAVWSGGPATLATSFGNPGQSAAVGATEASTPVNERSFAQINPTAADPIVLTGQIFDDGTSGNERISIGLRNGANNIIELGHYNQIAGAFYAYRVILFDAAGENPNWEAFDVNGTGGSSSVEGWHTYSAVITDSDITFSLDLGSNGTIDATSTVDAITSSFGFANLRFGGPSGLSSPGGGANFDNISLIQGGVIPEPASLGLLSVAGLGLLRRRK